MWTKTSVFLGSKIVCHPAKQARLYTTCWLQQPLQTVDTQTMKKGARALTIAPGKWIFQSLTRISWPCETIQSLSDQPTISVPIFAKRDIVFKRKKTYKRYTSSICIHNVDNRHWTNPENQMKYDGQAFSPSVVQNYFIFISFLVQFTMVKHCDIQE